MDSVDKQLDSNHNEYTGTDDVIVSDRILNCVTDGNGVGVKYLCDQGEDLNVVDDEGNTPLHLAIRGNHYNIAVMLLNHGCSLDVANHDGFTSAQLANKLGRSVFSIAIQLTSRNRAEKMKLEKKRKLIEEHEAMNSSFSDEEIEEEEDFNLILTNRLQSSTQSLNTAKKVVHDLENQLVTARSLVNTLEMDVSKLKLDIANHSKKKLSQKCNKSPQTITSELLDTCNVCLEIPRTPLHVYQCPQGHILCEVCKQRPELTSCPVCRVSLVGVNIRNTTLERLIRHAHL